MFNSEDFLSQTVDEPLADHFKALDEGQYRAVIGDFDSTAIEVIDFTYKQGDKKGQPGQMTKLTLPWVITGESINQKMGRDTLTVRQQIILDIDANGRIATGDDKNVKLGQIRKAVGQNATGGWSIMHLRGAGPALVSVKHRTPDAENDPERKFAEVVKVAPIR